MKSEMNRHHPYQRLVFIQRRWLLYIWWDWKGVLSYELLWENQTINSNKYCSQLGQLKASLDENYLIDWKFIIFHQGKTSPRVSLMTSQKLWQLPWEFLVHLPYSPDNGTSDFHLFWSSQNSFNGKKFTSLEDYKRHLEEFFAQKDKKFLGKKSLGKMELWNCLKKWQKIVEQNGDYADQ